MSSRQLHLTLIFFDQIAKKFGELNEVVVVEGLVDGSLRKGVEECLDVVTQKILSESPPLQAQFQGLYDNAPDLIQRLIDKDGRYDHPQLAFLKKETPQNK